jgi:DNA helicase II / ATP-dependent DNA helicase PcrA
LNHYLRCLLNDGINEFESTVSPMPPGFVSFLTFHQSKGLEFPVVFCGSLDASPWSQEHEIDEALEQAQLLRKPVFEPPYKVAEYDFKRLYYTAFTRAQNLLVLSVRNTSQHQPAKLGPFCKYLAELPNWDSDQFEPEQLNLSKLSAVHQYPELSLVNLGYSPFLTEK